MNPPKNVSPPKHPQTSLNIQVEFAKLVWMVNRLPPTPALVWTALVAPLGLVASAPSALAAPSRTPAARSAWPAPRASRGPSGPASAARSGRNPMRPVPFACRARPVGRGSMAPVDCVRWARCKVWIDPCASSARRER